MLDFCFFFLSPPILRRVYEEIKFMDYNRIFNRRFRGKDDLFAGFVSMLTVFQV